MTDYRKDFPLLSEIGENTVDGREWIYIDNAATSQRPQCVIDAERDFYLKHNANPLRGNYPLSVEATELYENARKGVRDFIGAKSAHEIIFTRNTTESMNLVAYSYGLNNVNAGDEILVSIMEHHSNLLPWQMVARQTGAVLRFIECRTDGSVDLDQVKEQITEKTKIVAITQVSNVLGRVNPVKEIAAMAHEKNAIVVVDGAQCTPHMPVNVQDLDADFFAFSGHKIFGPMGIGVLYGKKKLLKKMPPFLSGGEMIESVTRESAKYAELPHKFEAGTVNAAGAIALHAAIKYAQSVGFDVMQERELAVTKRAFDGLKELPHVRRLLVYIGLWQTLGVCGKLSTFRLCGAGVAHSGSSYFSSEHTVYPPAGGYRVLSLLRLCGRCENGVNYTLMSNAGCVAAAQNIQWTIV